MEKIKRKNFHFSHTMNENNISSKKLSTKYKN